jgi:hypothetical protein
VPLKIIAFEDLMTKEIVNKPIENPPSPAKVVKAAKPQDVPLEIGIDWFHFETRIRKVIHEVVDPLTKK